MLQGRRLCREIIRGRGELVTGRRILLNNFVELAHADVDLPDRRHLFLRGGGDFLNQVRGIPDHRHGPVEKLAGVLGDRDASPGELADLLRGGLAAFGEFADLTGDDREALALRTRPRGLDRRVQGQQVGLVGDVLDNRDLLCDLSHRVDGLLHRLATSLSVRACLVGRAGGVLGVLGVPRDRLVDRLKARGYAVELASGDRRAAVAEAAEATGIAEWRAQLTPQDKITRLAALKREGRHVLMVGDGLNDAPALATGHASLSPSTAIDISQNAADAVFQGEKLAPILAVLEVAKAARRRALQNFALAIGYNIVFVPLAMAGRVTPLIAALAMSASSIAVTANALRLGASREQQS